LCLGGHKHSYTCTYPIYESPSEIAQLLSNVEEFRDYDESKLFVTICDDSNTLTNALGVGNLYSY
jgi:hypothetical protein